MKMTKHEISIEALHDSDAGEELFPAIIVHNVSLGNRTVNGHPVAKAEIIEENGIFTARLTTDRGEEFVSGSNNRDYNAELAVLCDMFDTRPFGRPYVGRGMKPRTRNTFNQGE
jgi:hypothetical protein